jgi:hypothetical protein
MPLLFPIQLVGENDEFVFIPPTIAWNSISALYKDLFVCNSINSKGRIKLSSQLAI